MNVSSPLASHTAIPKNQTAEASSKAYTSGLSISSATKTLQQDRVTLSPEAFEKLKQEKKQSTTDTDKSSSKQKQLIEDLKERLKQLEQELKRLKNDKSEQALEQQKNIEHQIAALNATLIELIGKQLNSA